jgi:CubicO group peptidase (beta-lactamase class C family)
MNVAMHEMPVCAPEAQGVIPDLLTKAYAQAAAYKPLHSLLIARNGFLVGEAYFGEQQRKSTLNIKSATKSVISMLVGIALSQGLLRDVHQPLMELLPEYFTAQSDVRKRSLTLWHLLTMSAGLGWIENAGSLRHWHHSEDWAQFALNLPVIATPGNQFSYNTTLSHLLSIVLTRVSGMSTLEYAQQHLFGPLGIAKSRWKTDPQGCNIGGTELYLTSREMLKLGQLYQQDGVWRDRIVVPQQWVPNSTRQQMTLRKNGFWHPAYTGYGYQWWLRNMAGYPAAVASGYGGQFIYIVPDIRLVVVTTAHSDVPYGVVMQQSNTIEDIIEQYVMPAITKAE